MHNVNTMNEGGSGKPPKDPSQINKLKKQLRDDIKELNSIRGVSDSEKIRVSKELKKEVDTEINNIVKQMKENSKTSKGIAYGKTTKGGKTRRNVSGGKDIVTHLMTIRDQVKLYHWQTKQFAEHKATDDLLASLDTNIDTFVETYMGKYGRPSVVGTIKLHNYSKSNVRSFVKQESTWMSNVLPKKIKSTDTDLLNIRDEILGDLNKTAYLFTLQ